MDHNYHGGDPFSNVYVSMYINDDKSNQLCTTFMKRNMLLLIHCNVAMKLQAKISAFVHGGFALVSFGKLATQSCIHEKRGSFGVFFLVLYFD